MLELTKWNTPNIIRRAIDNCELDVTLDIEILRLVFSEEEALAMSVGKREKILFETLADLIENTCGQDSRQRIRDDALVPDEEYLSKIMGYSGEKIAEMDISDRRSTVIYDLLERERKVVEARHGSA